MCSLAHHCLMLSNRTKYRDSGYLPTSCLANIPRYLCIASCAIDSTFNTIWYPTADNASATSSCTQRPPQVQPGTPMASRIGIRKRRPVTKNLRFASKKQCILAKRSSIDCKCFLCPPGSKHC